jgi:hypothetical protein
MRGDRQPKALVLWDYLESKQQVAAPRRKINEIVEFLGET